MFMFRVILCAVLSTASFPAALAQGEGVRRGLEMMGKYDLGGYIIDFSPTKHWGSQFIELSLIGGSGRLVY